MKVRVAAKDVVEAAFEVDRMTALEVALKADSMVAAHHTLTVEANITDPQTDSNPLFRSTEVASQASSSRTEMPRASLTETLDLLHGL